MRRTNSRKGTKGARKARAEVDDEDSYEYDTRSAHQQGRSAIVEDTKQVKNINFGLATVFSKTTGC